MYALGGLIVLALWAANIGGASASNIQVCEGRRYELPQDFKVVCSATWQLTGPCSGEDLWDKWKVGGRTVPNDPFIRPWLKEPIVVVGYELVKLRYYPAQRIERPRDQDLSYFMIGSAIQPDAMIWLAPGQNHAKQMWAAGLGQPWPSKEKANPAMHSDMLDLHGSCFDGGEVSIFVTLYYVPIYRE